MGTEIELSSEKVQWLEAKKKIVFVPGPFSPKDFTFAPGGGSIAMSAGEADRASEATP
jgi:hypothetical protein